MPKSTPPPPPPLCFQDVMKEWKKKEKKTNRLTKNSDRIDANDYSGYDDENGDDNDVANVFFELANSTYVSYRLPKKKKHKKDEVKAAATTSNRNSGSNSNTTDIITIRQDVNACGKHTGGIVWETSYLLLEYLLRYYSSNNNRNQSSSSSSSCCCKNFLEVGAGCGLIGLGIFKMNIATQNVFVTETSDVMPNLIANVNRNTTATNDDDNVNNNNDNDDNTKNHRRQQEQPKLHTCVLDWTKYKEDCQKAHIRPHSIDTIVGTDVVFCQELVKPLLETIQYLAHSKSLILLCLQERCRDSYDLLFSIANEYELHVDDVTNQGFGGGRIRCCGSNDDDDDDVHGDSYREAKILNIPECSWGNDLECKLLKLSVVAKATTTTQSSTSKSSSTKRKKKKRKRDKD